MSGKELEAKVLRLVELAELQDRTNQELLQQLQVYERTVEMYELKLLAASRVEGRPC